MNVVDALLGKKQAFTFEISGSTVSLGVSKLSIREILSAPYQVDLELVSESELKFTDVVGKEGLLKIRGNKADRLVHGIIEGLSRNGKVGRFVVYTASIVPQISLLSHRQTSRVFQNKTIKEIIADVLKNAQIPSNRIEYRLQETHKPKEYCVQHQETDLSFLSRLIENEGIWYFFEHFKDKHILVFADGKSSYKPVEGAEKLAFVQKTGMVSADESVASFRCQKNIGSGKVSQTDFNYMKPSTPLQTQESCNENSSLEIFEYPGCYDELDPGKRLTRVRLQERTSVQEFGEGQTTSPLLSPGYVFTLSGYDNSACNQEYLITAVDHHGTQPQAFEENAAGGSLSYSNSIIVIPSKVDYRPMRRTAKPVILGPQTAIVVGPKGEEIYTDDQGRVKVQFHWDRQGKKDENSSCWIRVSQNSAGEGWGSMYIPRIGQEVIVSFLDGDPDRPIITGRVYNGANPPPHGLPDNKTKSTIMSQSSPGGGGANELSFEDSKGSEEIYLHAQKDLTKKVENNETLAVGKDRIITVGNDENNTVTKNRTGMVGGNDTLNVAQSQSTSVGGSQNETVGGVSNESVAMAKTLNVGGAYAINVGGGMNTLVGLIHADEVGLSRNTIVAKDLSTKVGKAYKIEAGDSFEVTCGSSKFIMKKDGSVVISGKKINIEATGPVEIKGSVVDLNP